MVPSKYHHLFLCEIRCFPSFIDDKNRPWFPDIYVLDYPVEVLKAYPCSQYSSDSALFLTGFVIIISGEPEVSERATPDTYNLPICSLLWITFIASISLSSRVEKNDASIKIKYEKLPVYSPVFSPKNYWSIHKLFFLRAYNYPGLWDNSHVIFSRGHPVIYSIPVLSVAPRVFHHGSTDGFSAVIIGEVSYIEAGNYWISARKMDDFWSFLT